ncbi:MAG: hypothetical protein EA385_02560 [Salinarimonadaceae bacterium]|nr:MAG: hypothetical protein EA385_02560 [Salinarimonadaceae bacterium]
MKRPELRDQLMARGARPGLAASRDEGGSQAMKTVITIGAATIIAAFLAFAPASPAQAAGAYVTNDLNMRAGPSTRHHVLRVLRAGSHVDVLRCAAGRSWCEVYHRGRTGWVSARYLHDGSRAHRVVPRSPGIVFGGPVVTFEFRAGPRYYAPPPRVRYYRDRRYRDWRHYDPCPYDPFWGPGW